MNKETIEYLKKYKYTIQFNTNNIILYSQNKNIISEFVDIGSVYKHLDDAVNNDKFYLEISPRQSGKTYRLINAVNKHLNLGGTAFIYTMNNQMDRYIENKLVRKDRVKFNPRQYDIKAYHFCDVRHFYDEFDYLSNRTQLEFHSSGYYSTTPCKLRTLHDLIDCETGKFNVDTDDFLIQLLIKNKIIYKSFESIRNLPECCNLNELGVIFK
jgi:hypothetical protein